MLLLHDDLMLLIKDVAMDGLTMTINGPLINVPANKYAPL